MSPEQELDWYRDEVDRLNAEVARLSAKLDNRKKLTPREVATIRDLFRAGYSQADIAEIYDVTRSTISRTVRGIYHARP